MHLTYEDKQRIVEEIAEKAESADVVGLLDMHELPAPQLQQIKKELKNTAEIRMSRRTLIERGLEQAGNEFTDLLSVDSTQPALIFSDENPFTLFQTIQQSKSAAPAKAGATVSKDVTLDPGPTGLPPGPALGELQALGAETSVEDGEIVIDNEPVAVQAGETITRDVALTLNKLDMKPLEVGLDLKAVVEEDVLYTRDALDIDMDQYETDIGRAAQHGFNVAVSIGYVTPETIQPLLQQGTTHANNLAVNAGYVTPETVEDVLRKAQQEAVSLDAAADTENVDIDQEPGQDEENTDESEDGDETPDEDTEENGGTDGEDENDGEDEPRTEEEPGEDETGTEPDAEENEETEENNDDNDDTETSQTQSTQSSE